MCESVQPKLGHTIRYIGNEEMSISGGPSRKLVFQDSLFLPFSLKITTLQRILPIKNL